MGKYEPLAWSTNEVDINGSYSGAGLQEVVCASVNGTFDARAYPGGFSSRGLLIYATTYWVFKDSPSDDPGDNEEWYSAKAVFTLLPSVLMLKMKLRFVKRVYGVLAVTVGVSTTYYLPFTAEKDTEGFFTAKYPEELTTASGLQGLANQAGWVDPPSISSKKYGVSQMTFKPAKMYVFVEWDDHTTLDTD